MRPDDPFRIPRDRSRAKDGARRRQELNDLAERLEGYIRAELAAASAGSVRYTYASLAMALGEDLEDVQEVMSRHPRGGHTGITLPVAGPGGVNPEP